MSLLERFRKRSSKAVLFGAVALTVFSSGCVGHKQYSSQNPSYGLQVMNAEVQRRNLEVQRRENEIRARANAAQYSPSNATVNGANDGAAFGFGLAALGAAWGAPGLSFLGGKLMDHSSATLNREQARVNSQQVNGVEYFSGVGGQPRPNGSTTPVYANNNVNGEKKCRVDMRMNDSQKYLVGVDVGELPKEKTIVFNWIDLNSDGVVDYGREARFRPCKDFYGNSTLTVMIDSHYYGGKKVKQILYDPASNSEIIIRSGDDWTTIENSPQEGTRSFIGKISVGEIKQLLNDGAKVSVGGDYPFAFRLYLEGEEKPCESTDITLHFNSLATNP